MIERRAFIAGAVAAAFFASRRARADELDDLLAKIGEARAPLKTLVGPFVQIRKIGLLASEVRSNGTLTLVRPDRLRWELAAPDDVVYWVTPEGLAYKSKSGEGRVQGRAAKVAAALDDLRTVLAGDLSALRARYDLRLIANTDAGPSFDATPREGVVAPVQKIAFALASDLVRPTRATLVEGPRDRSDITFGDLRRDADVDPDSMRVPASD
jgi:outer membrane lipoprotein-sorting protein